MSDTGVAAIIAAALALVAAILTPLAGVYLPGRRVRRRTAAPAGRRARAPQGWPDPVAIPGRSPVHQGWLAAAATRRKDAAAVALGVFGLSWLVLARVLAGENPVPAPGLAATIAADDDYAGWVFTPGASAATEWNDPLLHFVSGAQPDNDPEAWGPAENRGTPLAPYTAVSLRIHLHGGTLADDPATLGVNLGPSAGWTFASLARYTVPGADRWQTIAVPLADFVDLDTKSPIDASQSLEGISFRFWTDAGGLTVDVDDIRFVALPAGPSPLDPTLRDDFGDGTLDPSTWYPPSDGDAISERGGALRLAATGPILYDELGGGAQDLSARQSLGGGSVPDEAQIRAVPPSQPPVALSFAASPDPARAGESGGAGMTLLLQDGRALSVEFGAGSAGAGPEVSVCPYDGAAEQQCAHPDWRGSPEGAGDTNTVDVRRIPGFVVVYVDGSIGTAVPVDGSIIGWHFFVHADPGSSFAATIDDYSAAHYGVR